MVIYFIKIPPKGVCLLGWVWNSCFPGAAAAAGGGSGRFQGSFSTAHCPLPQQPPRGTPGFRGHTGASQHGTAGPSPCRPCWCPPEHRAEAGTEGAHEAPCELWVEGPVPVFPEVEANPSWEFSLHLRASLCICGDCQGYRAGTDCIYLRSSCRYHWSRSTLVAARGRAPRPPPLLVSDKAAAQLRAPACTSRKFRQLGKGLGPWDASGRPQTELSVWSCELKGPGETRPIPEPRLNFPPPLGYPRGSFPLSLLLRRCWLRLHPLRLDARSLHWQKRIFFLNTTPLAFIKDDSTCKELKENPRMLESKCRSSVWLMARIFQTGPMKPEPPQAQQSSFFQEREQKGPMQSTARASPQGNLIMAPPRMKFRDKGETRVSFESRASSQWLWSHFSLSQNSEYQE